VALRELNSVPACMYLHSVQSTICLQLVYNEVDIIK
jgi:hypothetical protein